jgi:DNA-binding NtrC family response regulator
MSLRILVAENDPGRARLVRNTLEQAGHEVLATVSSAEAALGIVHGAEIDLIVTATELNGPISGITLGSEMSGTTTGVIYIAEHHRIFQDLSPDQAANLLVTPFAAAELAVLAEKVADKARNDPGASCIFGCGP